MTDIVLISTHDVVGNNRKGSNMPTLFTSR